MNKTFSTLLLKRDFNWIKNFTFEFNFYFFRKFTIKSLANSRYSCPWKLDDERSNSWRLDMTWNEFNTLRFWEKKTNELYTSLFVIKNTWRGLFWKFGHNVNNLRNFKTFWKLQLNFLTTFISYLQFLKKNVTELLKISFRRPIKLKKCVGWQQQDDYDYLNWFLPLP